MRNKKVTYGNLFKFLEKKCNFKNGTYICKGLDFTEEFCKKERLNFRVVKKTLENTGGYCDCEVLFNSAELIKTSQIIE